MISIIIPLFNKSTSIRKTIDSILCQEFDGDYEIVVIDDGSTDDSFEVVSGYDDPRVRLFSKRNGGPSSARNLGVRESMGEWVIFLDADDYFLDCALQSIYSQIKRNGNKYQCLCFNFYKKNNGILKKYSRILKNGYCANPYKAWLSNQIAVRAGSIVINREVFSKYMFNESLHRYEDAEFILNVMRDFKFYSTDIDIMVYDCESVEASHIRKNSDEDFLGNLFFENKKFWERVVLYSLYLRAVKSYPKETYNKYIFSFCDKIQYRIALKYIGLFLRMDRLFDK